MSEGRRAWNAWDVSYFGTARRKLAAADRPAARDPGRPAHFLALRQETGRTAQRVLAVLFGVGSVLGGAALAGLLLFASFVLSFGSTPDPSEILVAGLLGSIVAVGGVALAVLCYRRAGGPVGVSVHPDRLEISYPSFGHAFVVPRSSVRVAVIDDGSGPRLEASARFPIAGALPRDVFADALDNMPAGPWDDLDPSRRGSSPSVISERPARRGEGYMHDEPDRPGWASGRLPAEPSPSGRTGYLWSAHGSSLPFLRLGPGDVPNVAVLFHDPLRAPRPSWWFGLPPTFSRAVPFRGGREVRGFLIQAKNPVEAEVVLGAWQVVRTISAEDVMAEGLLVAKPLAGWRAVTYGVVVLACIGVEVLFRFVR